MTMLSRLQSWFAAGVRFIAGGASRTFTLAEDQYPETGVQPYSGDPSNEH
jgi:hypothetical protein